MGGTTLIMRLVPLEEEAEGFPGGAVVENLPANAGDTGLNPGLEDPTCRRATGSVSHNY